MEYGKDYNNTMDNAEYRLTRRYRVDVWVSNHIPHALVIIAIGLAIIAFLSSRV